jgi:nitroimidazol reductase NimA-like FMN-containing flavoprotein (pyridoxamine 5'-phosphate oxidase superfamily)
MLLESLTRQDSIELLKRTKFGRLACAHDDQPYITPLAFVYDSDWLYSVSNVGQKIAWMRINPLVCVEVDEIVSRQNWASVIVFGRYEELPDIPEHTAMRMHAYTLMQKTPLWWEPAYVKPPADEKQHGPQIMYFRIHVHQISGRRAALEEPRADKVSWVRKILGRSERSF